MTQPMTPPTGTAGPTPEQQFTGFLVRHGLVKADESLRFEQLAGGVSSDIWLVRGATRCVCVKRALPKLKVADDWQAPIGRNASEWAWIGFAAQLLPGHVPAPLAHDPQAGMFAMDYLEPERFPVWKAQLLAGTVEPATAASVGALLGRLHSASAGRADLAAQFATLPAFRALRLDPYLIATARKHPSLSPVLTALAQRTAGAAIALVHGDISPKNILVGPDGPVFLDAECAWYGDPAFDLAFCLNHLLLKCLAVDEAAVPALRASFAALVERYLAMVDWEAQDDIERRTATLLPALMLARVDGKSPVEYLLGRDAQQARVRRFATRLLAAPVQRLSELAGQWHREPGQPSPA